MKTAIAHTLSRLSAQAALFKAFRGDRRGTGAVEFAIIAPLLIMAYIGSFEISVGLSVARKTGRAASTVADVLAQQGEVSTTYLDGMKDVAASIMTPFGLKEGYTLKMTGIKVTAEGVGTVAWSRDQASGTPYAAGSNAAVPSGLPVNAFIVRSEIVVPHEILLFAPGLTGHTLKTIHIAKTYYYRQRVGDQIDCTNCGA